MLLASATDDYPSYRKLKCVQILTKQVSTVLEPTVHCFSADS